jgi:hypothetical protein
MIPASPPASRQFFARPGVHVMVLAPLGLLLAAGIAAAIAEPNKEAGRVIAGLAVALTAIFYFPFVWRIRLRLGPSGIRASAPLCVLEATWDNVEHFYRCGTHAGIVTRRPLTGKGPERLRKSLLSLNPYDAQENEWLQENRYIPLRGFEHAVKNGAVERAVAAWAQSAAAEPVPPPPAERVPVKVWIIVGLCIVGGILSVTVLPANIERRVSSIVLFAALLAGTVSAFAHGLILWRLRARVMGGMEILLSAILALLTLAALVGIVEAFGK